MYHERLNTTPEGARDGRADPTRGLEDYANADARRDPTAGAPATLFSDPTRGREDPEIARDSHREASHQDAPSSPPLQGYRPAGHVIGHSIGEPPPPPHGDQLAGHVIAHAIGEPPPPPHGDELAGHVIAHAIGEPPPPPRGDRPAGHVIGHAVHGGGHPSAEDISQSAGAHDEQ